VLDAAVPATVQALLDQLDPTPAYVVGPLGNVVATNAAWRTLVSPLGLLDVPNLVRHVFLHPDARTIYPAWDQEADAQVAHLHHGHHLLTDDPAFTGLLAEMLEVPAFAQRWNAHRTAQPRSGPTVIHHPDVGDLQIDREALRLAEHDQQLIAWLPADDATADALRRATVTEHPVSPAHLRVVGQG